MSWLFLESEKEWDTFVEKEEEARFIHLTGFKRVIEKVYKFIPIYLCYKKGNQYLAIFSSFIQNTILSGKRIISQPFSEYGGLLISKEIDQNEKHKIVEELFSILDSIIKKEKLKGVEIRGKTDKIVERFVSKVHLGEYGIKKLKKELDLWKSVDYMVRKAVRKAEREGVRIVEDPDFERIKDFYRLHLISMKRLGSPPHPFSYFVSLKEELIDKMKIFYAVHNGRIISALLGWKVGKIIHITDNPSDRRYFHLRGNDYLHYKMIEWAKDNGYESFDFGPIRYYGQEFYKRKWRLEKYEYSIFYYPSPLNSIAYTPPFYVKLARNLWRFVPTIFSRYTGKFLRRELGL